MVIKTFQIQKKMIDPLRVLAFEERTSQSEIIRRALSKYMLEKIMEYYR